MARTTKRHILTDTVFVRPKAQYVNAFGAEERHAGFVGFRGDPGPGEVLAQVRADFRQDVDHSAGGGVCSLGTGAGGGGGGVCSLGVCSLGAGSLGDGADGAGGAAGGSGD